MHIRKPCLMKSPRVETANGRRQKFEHVGEFHSAALKVSFLAHLWQARESRSH